MPKVCRGEEENETIQERRGKRKMRSELLMAFISRHLHAKKLLALKEVKKKLYFIFLFSDFVSRNSQYQLMIEAETKNTQN